MRRHAFPVWRDYRAIEQLGDGSTRELGPFSAKVGHAFDYCVGVWPEVFKAGRGRIVSDDGAVAQGGATVARLAHNQEVAGSTPAPATTGLDRLGLVDLGAGLLGRSVIQRGATHG
jgi:hypothetical protein